MSVVDNSGKDINVPTKTTVLDAIVFYMRRVKVMLHLIILFLIIRHFRRKRKRNTIYVYWK